MNGLEPDFAGRIGRTFHESEPWWRPNGPRATSAPDIVQIVFDDTGWADFGCFGSEIATPVLDGLAAAGLRYNNFHVTPLCSPTRACLLTGRNHHKVGMRFLSDIDTGFPNARGRVDPGVRMVPEQLRAKGYGTYLVGKWHLTPQHEITPAGPYGQWPLARGFDRFYGFLDGCTDQFAPELYEDNHFREPPGGADYNLTTDLADQAIRMISDHAVFRPHDPLYLLFAPGATHAPLQAPRALIDKYVPVFEKGWDRTREDRLARQIALGLVPEGTALTPRNPGVPAWDTLSDDEKRLFVRLQAAYAAFLEQADGEIGRILHRLAALGRRDNALVMAFSDNGASREGGRNGTVDINGPYSGVMLPVSAQLERIEEIGGPMGPAHYPVGWAMAGNTPFRRYKQSVELGGVRSPLIVNWPAGIADRGAIREQFAHVIDLGATALASAGGSDPGMDGASLEPTFSDGAAPAPRQVQYWEMFGSRALHADGWKAITEHEPGADYETDRWRLYDTRADFAETRDLAAEQPERVKALVALWWREAEANRVAPLDDRTLVELLNVTRTPYQLVNRKRLVLRPENTHLPVSSGVTSASRSMRIGVQLRGRKADGDGILVASGSGQGGYCLHLAQGRPVFEHHALGQRSLVASATPLPEGDSLVGVVIERAADGSAGVRLTLDGRVLAEGRLPLTIAHPSFWGLDVGRDPVSPTSATAAAHPGLPAGVLETVTLEFLEAMTEEELAELLAQTD